MVTECNAHSTWIWQDWKANVGVGGIYNLEKSKNKICWKSVMFVYIIIICADTPTFAAGGCNWQNSELTKGTAHNEKLSE